MSAMNGGRGTPPVPPLGHGPPAPAQEVPIVKEVTWQSQQTTAERGEQGGRISFVVIEGGMPVAHHYLIGDAGKKVLLEELSGGLTIPT